MSNKSNPLAKQPRKPKRKSAFLDFNGRHLENNEKSYVYTIILRISNKELLFKADVDMIATL